MKKKNDGFTISGPGVDKGGYENGDVGLSAAITYAQRVPEGNTVYVRDADGGIYGRVEHLEGGACHVFKTAKGGGRS